MSKKAAFTMVELIFVIVILGILAAVAVPRLNASRNDAKLAALKANIKTVFKDLETYYAANGTFGSAQKSAKEFSNVPLDDQGFLDVEKGKQDCLAFLAYSNAATFVVMPKLHPVCTEALEDSSIKQLLWGYDGQNLTEINGAAVPNEGASKINAFDARGGKVYRIMNEDGVSWD